jgi:hypothetical protein
MSINKLTFRLVNAMLIVDNVYDITVDGKSHKVKILSRLGYFDPDDYLVFIYHAELL